MSASNVHYMQPKSDGAVRCVTAGVIAFPVQFVYCSQPAMHRIVLLLPSDAWEQQPQGLQKVWNDVVRKLQFQDFPFVAITLIKGRHCMYFKHTITLKHLLEGSCAATHTKIVCLGCNISNASRWFDGLQSIHRLLDSCPITHTEASINNT